MLYCRAWENRITKALDGDYKGEKGDTIDEAVRVLVSLETGPADPLLL